MAGMGRTVRSWSKKESDVGKAELWSAPSCIGGGLTQSDLSKASSSQRAVSRESLMFLFSIVLPRQSFPPVHPGRGFGVLRCPSACEASSEGIELGSVCWCWGALCAAPGN